MARQVFAYCSHNLQYCHAPERTLSTFYAHGCYMHMPVYRFVTCTCKCMFVTCTCSLHEHLNEHACYTYMYVNICYEHIHVCTVCFVHKCTCLLHVHVATCTCIEMFATLAYMYCILYICLLQNMYNCTCIYMIISCTCMYMFARCSLPPW